MSTIDYNALLARTIATAKEGLASISITADGVPYFYHVQDGSFPYMTTRVSNVVITDDEGEEFDLAEVTVILRLIVDHLTADYDGNNEAKLYTYMDVLREWFNEHDMLQSATYPTAMDALYTARITSIAGLRVFDNTGLQSVQQVGTDFTITCQFELDITQATFK